MRSLISSISRASSSEWAAAVTAAWNSSSPSTPRPPAIDVVGHGAQRGVDAREVALGTPLRGQGGELGLQRVAGVDDLGQPVGVGADRLDGTTGAGVPDLVAAGRQAGPDPGHDRAVAVPDADRADDLEGDEGLAQRGPADAEAGGELALGRQPVAGGEVVVGDPGRDLRGHLLVEPGAHEPTRERRTGVVRRQPRRCPHAPPARWSRSWRESIDNRLIGLEARPLSHPRERGHTASPGRPNPLERGSRPSRKDRHGT